MPVIMVTRAVAGLVPVMVPTVQTPAVPLIVGATPAFVVAVTVKVAASGAVAGAPVKLTVGVASAAFVVWVAVAERNVVVAAQFAVSVHRPVPAIMVTVAVARAGVPVTALTTQTLGRVGIMVGMTLAFVVAVTVKVVL